MLEKIEADRVGVVIVKGLSRFARNSAMAGMYINSTFAGPGVRFIAINDNYDTIDPNSMDNDFAGIKNWFNEFYAEIPDAKSGRLSLKKWYGCTWARSFPMGAS